MRSRTVLVAVIILAVLLAPGCLRRKKVITQAQVQKTIVHSAGTTAIQGGLTIAPQVKAENKDGEIENIRGLSKTGLEEFLAGRDSVQANSVIMFGDFELPLETKTVDSHKDLKSLNKTLDRRMSSVNKFMQSKSMQLDARRW